MITVIIPARGGSKGLKLKNIHYLCGKPLLYYSLEAAREISSDIYVSTDSAEIEDVVYELGGKVIRRPPLFSSDSASTESVLKHATEFLQIGDNENVCYLSPCDPIRKKGALSTLFSKFKKAGHYDSLFYGRESHRHYWHKSVGSIELVADWMTQYQPRQYNHLDQIILECTGYGLITKACYWKSGKRFGGSVGYLNIDSSFPEVDIHTAIDIRLAETILEYMKDEVVR